MPQNLDTAYAYFVTAANQNDPLGHNGLGYIYFRGTNAQAGRRPHRSWSSPSFGQLHAGTQLALGLQALQRVRVWWFI